MKLRLSHYALAIWQAGITVGGKKEYLGRFESEATAHEAYLRRASQIEKGQT